MTLSTDQPRIADGTFTTKAHSRPDLELAADDAPVGYTYRAENWRPQDLIAELVRRGELSPAALDMNPEDALNQHAGANAIDRDDEYSFDSDEFPKIVDRHQLSCSDLDWTSYAPEHIVDEDGVCETCGIELDIDED